MSTLIEKTPAQRAQPTPETLISQAEGIVATLHQLEDFAVPLREQLGQLEARKLEQKALLQTWADDHKDLFTGKMLKVNGGEFGYRTGVKSVSFPLEAPADIQAKYLKIVKEEIPDAIEEKVDSKKVVHGWGLLPALRKRLEKLGLRIKQPEQFIVSLKKRNDHE